MNSWKEETKTERKAWNRVKYDLVILLLELRFEKKRLKGKKFRKYVLVGSINMGEANDRLVFLVVLESRILFVFSRFSLCPFANSNQNENEKAFKLHFRARSLGFQTCKKFQNILNTQLSYKARQIELKIKVSVI